MSIRVQSKTVLAGALLAIFAVAPTASADTLYFQSVETDSTFYSGVDFQVTSTTHISQIGGLFASGLPNSGNIFGAIIPVASLSTAPTVSTITNTAVAHTLLAMPTTADDIENISGPVSVDLPAGSYALIFGSGLYGASAAGGTAAEFINAGTTPTTTGGEITYALQTSTGSEFLQAAGSRYFVDVPEPSSALLLLILSAPTLLTRQRRKNFAAK